MMFKFYRLTGIVDLSSAHDRTIAIIEPTTENATPIANTFDNGSFRDETQYKSPSAFDGNPNTIAHSVSDGDVGSKLPKNGVDYIIGFELQYPDELLYVSLQTRSGNSYYQEWQYAVIEASVDGYTWVTYGLILPKIPLNSKTLKKTEVLMFDELNLNNIDNEITYLNTYFPNSSGSFDGLVTQGESSNPKVPLEADVFLYDRLTNKLLQRTRSNALGAYTFSSLSLDREYYVVAIHPSRIYNAVIQDGLRAGMTHDNQ